MEKLYKITGRTNRWIAQRDHFFKGRCKITFSNNMTLRQAQIILLEYFNADFGYSYTSWGCVLGNPRVTCWSSPDGTRGYEYDGRYYSIEEQEGEEEENYGIV